MSFDHSCPAEWPISKRKNTVFLAFFGAVAAQKSWLNVFTIVMTTKDTWTTLSLSPIANGSGCCKFPDQKTSRFPSTSCRLATYIEVFYRLLDIHNSYMNDGIKSYLLLHQTTKPGCDPCVQLQRIPKVLRFDKHPIKIITEHLGVAFIDKAFTTNKERFLMSALDRTFSGLL